MMNVKEKFNIYESVYYRKYYTGVYTVKKSVMILRYRAYKFERTYELTMNLIVDTRSCYTIIVNQSNKDSSIM